MKLPVVLQPAARQEFDEAGDFYENRRRGEGKKFAVRVVNVFKRISANPRMHTRVRGDVRKATVGKYPYCVYYRVLPDRIEVISVFHTSRDPNIWQSRV